MTYEFAKRCSDKLVEWLAPFAERIQVAGSIRRQRTVCNDIDLVVIPKLHPVKDLFGNVTSHTNVTLKEVIRRGEAEGWRLIKSGTEITSIEAKGVQVDVFWAKAETFGSVLLCRTGSGRHNIWLAQQANEQGAKWHSQIGLYRDRRIIGDSEAAIYRALGLPYLDPTHQRDGAFVNIRPRPVTP
jgi:DNA polymerase (family X)